MTSGQDFPYPRTDPFPSFDSFRDGTDILSRINDFGGFEYTVFYQANGTPFKSLSDAVAGEGLAVLNDVLERTGIHRLHSLDVQQQEPSSKTSVDTNQPIVTFRFDGDVLHCAFSVYDDRFTIKRGNSSLESFYKWYSLIMPQATTIESSLRRITEIATKQQIRMVQTQHEFTTIFSDFRELGDAKKFSNARRNVGVLDRLIPTLPDERGEMRELGTQDFYRVNLSFSRLERFRTENHEKTRNAWYFIEAPANENGRYLHYRTQLRNASIELLGSQQSESTTAVTKFDPHIANEHRLALHDFWRDRSIEGVARRFLSSWDFETKRQI